LSHMFFNSELSETEVAWISIFVSLCDIINVQGTQRPLIISLLSDYVNLLGRNQIP